MYYNHLHNNVSIYTMNYRIKISFLLLIFSLSAAAQQYRVEAMPMIRALQSAEFDLIMPYMNDKLEIDLPDEHKNIVSKKQAKAILSNYFKKNKMIFAGFQNKTTQLKLQTLTYISKTSTKTFTIFVVVKNEKIIGIKIKCDDE